MLNQYKILDLPQDASADEIKKAYRKKAKLFHPDVNKTPQAHELFIQIKQAYEVLSDVNEKYLFDLKLSYASSVHSQQRKPFEANRAKSSKRKTHQYHPKDWTSFQKPQRFYPTETFFKLNPLLYNSLFIYGILVGLLLIAITLWCTYFNIWPKVFVLIATPGIILVIEGWKGVVWKEKRL